MYNRNRTEQKNRGLRMHGAIRPALGALMLVVTGLHTGLAQTAPAPSKEEEADKVLTLETMVVTGYRESLANALEAERAASTIKSVISADNIGSLPDKNVAEALSRLAGVSMAVSDGEGRFVTIRGVEPGLNGITMNGETVATSDTNGRSGRAAPLDVLSTAAAGTIEVHKTVTADMDGQSIGGTINIITPSAFDYDRAFRFFGTAEGGMNDMSAERDIYSLNLNYAQRFANNKFGVFVSGTKSHSPYSAQDAQIRRWNNYGPNGDWLPDEIRITQKDGYRDRAAATLNLEYRPDDERKFYLRVYTTEYEDSRDRPQSTIRFRHGTPSSPTRGIATLRTATYEGLLEQTIRTTDQYVAGFELPLTPNLKLSASGNYSQAEENNPILTYVQMIVPAATLSAIQSRNTSYYDITDAKNPHFIFPGELYMPQNWQLSIVRPEQSYVEEKTKTGKVDLEWKGDLFGKNATVKAGVKTLNRQKSVLDITSGYTPVGSLVGATFASDFGTGPLGVPNGVFQNGRYVFGYRHNRPAYLDFMDKTLPEWPGSYVDHGNEYWVFQTAYALGNSLEDAYHLTEKISAAYLMASVDVNPKFTLFGGVRFEHTEESLSANLFLDGATSGVEDLTLGNDYDTVLPNLQFKYDVNDKMVVRGALTYTIGRPDFIDMVPIAELSYLDVDNNGLYEGYLESGNPDLKPYESMNVDLFLTYYLPSSSAVSLGYFHKTIDNPIYDWVREDIDVEFAGRQFETLTRETRFNADPGKIDGVEISYQQNFTFLPAPFDGFGAVINYAWIKSSVTTFDRPDEVTFFRQPDYVGNVQLYFQNKRFEARLAYHFQGANLEGLGDGPTEDTYGDKRATLDFKGSVRLNDNWGLYFEARNITNESDRNYLGDDRYYTLLDESGVTYLGGITWTY